MIRLGRLRTRRAHSPPRPAMEERPDRGLDLWVSGKEVVETDLPQSFARIRGSSREGPFEGHLAAMSADILLTRHSQGPFPISRKGALTCGLTL